MLKCMNDIVMNDNLYKDSQQFRGTYNAIVNEPNGPWGVMPEDFVPDEQGRIINVLIQLDKLIVKMRSMGVVLLLDSFRQSKQFSYRDNNDNIFNLVWKTDDTYYYQTK